MSRGCVVRMSTGERTRPQRTDIAISFTLFALGAIVVFAATSRMDPRLLSPGAMDLWFEADAPRVFENLVDRWSNFSRAKVHPLFGLLAFPPVLILRKLLGFQAQTAVHLLLGLTAGTWLALFFVIFRLIGCPRLDALIFTLLAATSSCAMFWFVIPETHPLASLTILFAIGLVALSMHRRIPALLNAAVSAATLGITVTNWMIGAASTLVRRPWRETLQVTINAFAVVCVLWAIARHFMPSTLFFLGNPPETGHILAPEARGPARVAISFFLHSMVMPAIAVVDRPGSGDWPIMLVQPSSPGSAGVWDIASLVLWLLLIGAGLYALFRVRSHNRLRLFLALTLAGQLALHLLFGNETFLYAPNFLPLLITMTAVATLTPLRPAVLATASLLVVTNVFNNGAQWRRADGFMRAFQPFQHDEVVARKARPEGPWPDARQTQRMALPGTRSFETGAWFPGGSFSPGLSQFSVALWGLDDAGRRTFSSDVPRPEVTTQVTRGADETATAIDVQAPEYRAQWKPAGRRRWRLDLQLPRAERIALMVRSVGPQTGPVRRLEWDGGRLHINERWIIRADSGVAAVALLDEDAPDWAVARSAARRLFVIGGWGAARLELSAPGSYTFFVSDEDPEGPVDRLLTMLPGDAVNGNNNAAAAAESWLGADSATVPPGGRDTLPRRSPHR